MAKQISKYRLMALGATTLVATPALAAAPTSLQEGVNNAQGDLSNTNLQDQVKVITNTLLIVIGISAVIMLIIGGFRYVFSAGDQAAVASAKNTILYAIVGIVVAILAFAIVNFVISKF